LSRFGHQSLLDWALAMVLAPVIDAKGHFDFTSWFIGRAPRGVDVTGWRLRGHGLSIQSFQLIVSIDEQLVSAHNR
jgi:hypothetical protein